MADLAHVDDGELDGELDAPVSLAAVEPLPRPARGGGRVRLVGDRPASAAAVEDVDVDDAGRDGGGAAWEASAAAFSEERMLRPAAEPPEQGWRRALWRATGGAVNPGPGPAERSRRVLVGRVTAPVAGSRRVVVMSRKGGVGKTSTALMLGHTFAAVRGDRVVALDANPDAGSLGYRVRRETSATVTTLLRDRAAVRRYADVRAYTSQAPSRLEVVASDDDPTITQALGDAEYRAAIDVLDRHYNLLLVDAGTGILDAGTQGVLAEADQVVVVLPPAIDGARAGASTLDWLDANGYPHLVRTAVAAVNAVRPGSRAVDEGRVEGHFAGRCAATARIPWDPHLEAGAQVEPGRLWPATRAAYLELAAHVADQFAVPVRRRQRPID